MGIYIPTCHQEDEAEGLIDHKELGWRARLRRYCSGRTVTVNQLRPRA
jgi:hypothetical protein